ncbi:MAG: FMN-binding protein [Porticoccus sp.]
MALLFGFALLFTSMVFSSAALGKGVYQTVPEFLTEVFSPEEPQQEYLWLTPELKTRAGEIMKHSVRGLRVRYWLLGTKTVWIMEEIGKELPITIGVVVNQGSIEQVKILAFRESRGWEVRYPAFTAQYLDVKMTPEKKLDTHIDGITGATLSVRAVTKVATLALFYHQQVISAQEKPSQSKLSQNKETSPLVTETP